jgi:hypothetical protein
VASRAFPAAHCAPKQPAARAERGDAAAVELLAPAAASRQSTVAGPTNVPKRYER